MILKWFWNDFWMFHLRPRHFQYFIFSYRIIYHEVESMYFIWDSCLDSRAEIIKGIYPTCIHWLRITASSDFGLTNTHTKINPKKRSQQQDEEEEKNGRKSFYEKHLIYLKHLLRIWTKKISFELASFDIRITEQIEWWTEKKRREKKIWQTLSLIVFTKVSHLHK